MPIYTPEEDDLSNWLFLFEVLSLQSAHCFLPDMEFNIPVTLSLQEHSRQYVCSYLKPSQNHLKLWQNTMKHIEKDDGLHVVEAIIDWVENVYYKYQDEKRFSNRVLESFLFNLFQPKNVFMIENLNLSDQERVNLQKIVVDYREGYINFDQRFENLEPEIIAEAEIAWKDCYDYLMYADGRLSVVSLQAHFILTKDLLLIIQSIFSQEALKQLKYWSEKIF